MTRGGRTRSCPCRILKEYYDYVTHTTLRELIDYGSNPMEREYYDYVARAEFLLERGYVTHTTLRELIEKLQKLDLDKKESKK